MQGFKFISESYIMGGCQSKRGRSGKNALVTQVCHVRTRQKHTDVIK